jgi:hypothetical protein
MCEVGFGCRGSKRRLIQGVSLGTMHIMSSQVKSTKYSSQKKSSGNQSWPVTTHRGGSQVIQKTIFVKKR